MKILLIDDDANILALLEMILNNKGYKTDVAYNGQEALRVLQHEDFDMIITDLKMPLMNGVDFIKAFREFDKDTSIIVFSGVNGEKISGLDVYSFVEKDDMEKLIRIVDEALDFKEKLPALNCSIDKFMMETAEFFAT